MTLHRRDFLKNATFCGMGLSFSPVALGQPWMLPSKRMFTMSLDPGSIGAKFDQQTAISVAADAGFEAVTPNGSELSQLDAAGLEQMKSLMVENKLKWGVAGLPMDFRKDAAAFAQGLAELPKVAAALQQVGATRMSTWIMPMHQERTYLQNFRLHADRIRQIATILADFGIRFGLEYVGPKTLRDRERYAFIHSLAQTRELIDQVGRENVGVVLDSFHWYTAGETQADLLTLTNAEVVSCDLNDAVAGLKPQEQQDGSRELPMATGVIKVKDFLDALVKIGFDGPVRAEPFNKSLNEMEDRAAAKATALAMKKAFDLV